MAYISAEEVKTIRKNLKKAFPKIKFSITTKNYSKVHVAIISSEFDFSEILGSQNNVVISSSNPVSKKGEFSKMFNTMIKIIKNDSWFNNSDIMTDYFDYAYYFDLSIGKWDKPYIKNRV